jgi:hypothetical protein
MMAFPFTVQAQAPRVITANGDGAGYAIMLHADYSWVSVYSPAQPGEMLTLYLIGLGAVTPPVGSGAPAGDGGAGGPLNLVSEPPSVVFDSTPASVSYAGLSPNSVGLYQINVTVPQGLLTSSPNIVVAAGAAQSQANVSVAANVTPSAGNQWYVALNGSPGASGTKSHPWDLATALGQPAVIRPGDTIWLRNGTYGDGTTTFVSTMTGTSRNPIVVRQYPGERATINGSLTVNGADTWYWGFEVTNLLPGRTSPTAGSFGGLRTWGVNANGPGTRFINMVVHDADAGFGFWTPARDAEIYGCLIYANGWQGPDRGHGHGIYTQNQDGTKHIGDNIIFNQFDLGIQAYGSAAASVQNILVDGNILFNNGSLGGQFVDNILFGFAGSISGIRIDGNYLYDTPSASSGYSRVGWSFGGFNQDVSLTGNYWIGGYYALDIWNWSTLTYSNNTAYAVSGTTLGLSATNGQQMSKYTFASNTYYGSGLFAYNGQVMKWADWKAATTLDADARMNLGRPQGTWVFARPNKYEPGRANIVVYNWGLSNSVSVDLSKVLQPGASFEIRDAERFYGPPIVTGAYGGGSVTIPMTNLTVAQPVGTVPGVPHTAPEFGAFVVIAK